MQKFAKVRERLVDAVLETGEILDFSIAPEDDQI